MKKTLLCCVSLLALAMVAVLGTLAYLTDRDSVVNTFTVGHIEINLDESKVDESGVPVPGADRVKANEYHLLPGVTYVKDPAVTVAAGSEDAYVRMILTVHNAGAVQAILDKYNLGDFSALIGGWDEEIWRYEGYSHDSSANTISFEFRYHEIVKSSASDVPLPALFESLVVPGDITGAEMQALYSGGFKMEIFGHAIQSAVFTSEDQAWESFALQVK